MRTTILQEKSTILSQIKPNLTHKYLVGFKLITKMRRKSPWIHPWRASVAVMDRCH